MTNAFSVLSLKRNRSTTKGNQPIEPSSKLSKLKSGLSIFSKITQSITQHDHKEKRMGLFQYFRSNEDQTTKLYEKNDAFEYNHYHSAKQSERHHGERNIHTLPTISTTQKLTSILIKRSDTNPTTLASRYYQPKINRARTYSNATNSNMTINSEDLTAKEFADIAGIRILPEDMMEEDEEGDYDSELSTAEERRFSKEYHDDEMMASSVSSHHQTTKSSTDHHDRLSLLSYTSLSSYSTSVGGTKLKIWDHDFWSHPELSSIATTTSRKNSIKSRISMSSNTLNRKPSTRSIHLGEPSILHELRRMNTGNTSEKSIIKKGRFEIQLGSDQTRDLDTVEKP